VALVPSSSRGGSSGTPLVTESAYYSGGNVTIADGDSGRVSWSILDFGDNILDNTDPLQPIVRKAGLFFVSAQVETPSGFTAGGNISAELYFDYTGDAPFVATFAIGIAGYVALLISGSYKLTAGQAIRLNVNNNDGASSRAFVLKNALVSRIGAA
jgi:hypothetical protein